VAVGGVSPGTLTKAFNVEIPANGATIVEFELNPPVTTQKSAQVKVDPDNAIKETNEDNNNTTFVLTPPVEQPEIVISGVSFGATTIGVTIKNEGGPLAASTVTVKVTVGGVSAQKVEQIALATGQSYPFTVPRPGTGSAVIEVLVNGTVVTTQNLNIE
jgi:subtilase family serine protease